MSASGVYDDIARLKDADCGKIPNTPDGRPNPRLQLRSWGPAAAKFGADSGNVV